MSDRIPERLASFGRRLKGFPIKPRARVYFLVKDGEVVYVGKTLQLPRRISAHLSQKRGEFDSVFYLNVAARDVNGIESRMIYELAPKLNSRKEWEHLFAGGDVIGDYEAPPRAKPIRRRELTFDDLREAAMRISTFNRDQN